MGNKRETSAKLRANVAKRKSQVMVDPLPPSPIKAQARRKDRVRTTSWTPRTRNVWALSWSAAFAVAIVFILGMYGSVSLPFTPRNDPFHTVITSTTTANDKVLAFLNWFHTAGGISNKITITTFEEMGRGVLATGPIEEDDVMLFVPKHLMLCRETILKATSTTPALYKKFEKLAELSEELLTAFLLLEQLNSTTNHAWGPYLEILPEISTIQSIASPLFYPQDSDVLELQDTRMISAATQERQRTKLAFQRFRRLFRDYIPSTPSLYQQYQFARFLINSRAFSLHGQRYLVPFGDVFNGKPHARARTHANGQHFVKYHHMREDGSGIEIKADRTTPRGDQVMEDYGDNDNYLYFVYHGFLMPANPLDCTQIKLPVLHLSLASDEEAAMGHAKLAILRHYKMDNGPTVCIGRHGTMVSPVDQMVLDMYYRLHQMDHSEMLVCGQEAMYEHCFGSMDGRDSSRLRVGNKTHQLGFLKQGIEQQLSLYATSMEDDQDILNKSEKGVLYHAVQFRLSRKLILKEASERLTRRMQQIQQHQKEKALKAQEELPIDTTSLSLNERIDRFTQWIHNKLDIPINAIELRFVSQALGYGAFATRHIARGDVYLSVTTQYVLDIHSALESRFVQSLMARDPSVRYTDQELLVLHLMDETFRTTPPSQWKPYLDILPDPARLTSTSLFYDETGPELELLVQGHVDLRLLMQEYRARVNAEYTDLAQRLDSKAPEWLTNVNFRWAMAILDSRSIWWSNQRHLVPLLDMVNCIELDSLEHTPHSTQLEQLEPVSDDQDSVPVAVTKASWAFAPGDQIVENYGQPNYIYLLYHGFVLDTNSYDCAHYRFDLTAVNLANGPSRDAAIATLERLGLYTWTPDVCVNIARQSGQKTSKVENSLSTLIEVAALQVGEPQDVTAALRATRMRRDHVTQALNKYAHQDKMTSTMVYKYTQQQQTLLTAIEQVLSDY